MNTIKQTCIIQKNIKMQVTRRYFRRWLFYEVIPRVVEYSSNWPFENEIFHARGSKESRCKVHADPFKWSPFINPMTSHILLLFKLEETREILFTMILNCNIIGCWWSIFYRRIQNITFKSFFIFPLCFSTCSLKFSYYFYASNIHLKKKEIDFRFLYFITRVQQNFLVFYQHIY